MPVPFDSLPRASFFGISFVVKSIRIKCRLRTRVHEYPHAPGGDIEKLERGLYEISIDAVFLVGVTGYQTAWPDDLRTLREVFEQGVTDDLVLPTIGTIKAVCIDWDQAMEANVRNGETARFTFLEDAKSALLVDASVAVSYTTTTEKFREFEIALQAIPNSSGIGLFDAIASLVSQIQGYRDQIDLYGELIALKAEQLASICRKVDAEDSILDDPAYHDVVRALHELGVAASTMAKDVLQKSTPFIEYVTPTEMPVNAVSRAMYGDTTHSVELLKLNAFEDALHIPANTTVRGYGVPAPLGTLQTS